MAMAETISLAQYLGHTNTGAFNSILKGVGGSRAKSFVLLEANL